MALRTGYISFLWGMCEATFFFLVPDVWLTRIAIKDSRKAFLNVLFALSGALIGGTVLYFLSQSSFSLVRLFMDFVPGISEKFIDRAGNEMRSAPVWAIVDAGFSGAPFKMYAAWAGHLNISLFLFLVASAVARFLRFLVVVGVAILARRILSRYCSVSKLMWMHGAMWTVFYCYYFWRVGF